METKQTTMRIMLWNSVKEKKNSRKWKKNGRRENYFLYHFLLIIFAIIQKDCLNLSQVIQICSYAGFFSPEYIFFSPQLNLIITIK